VNPQGHLAENGTSPRVMCPSEASTCQANLYFPGFTSLAVAAITLETFSGNSGRVVEVPSALTSRISDLVLSTRTLNLSVMSILGRVRKEFGWGLDGKRIG